MKNKEKRKQEKMRRDCQFNYSPLRAWPWKDVTCYLSKYSWNCPTDWETYCKSRGTNQRAAIKTALNIIYNAFTFRRSTLGNRLLQLYRREGSPPLTIRGAVYTVPKMYRHHNINMRTKDIAENCLNCNKLYSMYHPFTLGKSNGPLLPLMAITHGNIWGRG